MDNHKVDIDAESSDADLVNDFLAAKARSDAIKADYDSACKKLLARFARDCQCNNQESVGLDLHIEECRQAVRIEPTVKLSVVDFDALPASVKPFVAVTEVVTLTPAAKSELDAFLTLKYGVVEFGYSEDYFNSIGLVADVTNRITAHKVISR